MESYSGGNESYRDAINRGEWGRAIALLEAKAADPRGNGLSPEEQLTLGSLLGVHGEIERALRIMSRLSRNSDPAIAVKARVERVYLQLSSWGGDTEVFTHILNEAAELAGEDRALLGLVEHARSRVFWRNGEYEKAGECLEEARRILEEAGDEQGLAKVLDSLASFYEFCEQHVRALSCYSLSISKKAQNSDLQGIAITLGNLGRMHLRMNDPVAALSCLRDDFQIAAKLGDIRGQVVVRINIGQALTQLGRTEEAETELTKALQAARKRGFLEQEVYALKDLATTVARGGDHERASDLFRAALQRLPQVKDNYERGQVLLALGEFLLEQDELEEAQTAFREASEVFAAVTARQEEARAFHGLARVAKKRGDLAASIHFAEEGIALASYLGSTTGVLFQSIFKEIDNETKKRPVPLWIGRYRIIEEIGRGAYADVWRGVGPCGSETPREVAIKCLRFDEHESESLRKERIVRFKRECEILSRVEHRNIVRLYEFGDDPQLYLVMEYLPLGNLIDLTRKSAPLPFDRVLEIARGILNGLTVVHEHGIVHRDLKPANVLLRSPSEPVIVDFGMARVLAASAFTLRSTVLGTVAYMPPEQLRGPEVDARADLYAFGGIMFHLLAGRPPLEAKSLPEMVGKIRGETPLSICRLRGDVPSFFADCVARCLEKNPEKRFTSAMEVLDVLDRRN